MPLAIVHLVLKSAGMTAAEVKVLSEILLFLLYLVVPAVIETGSAVKGLSKSWMLMGTNTLFIFTCAFVAWLPTFLPSAIVQILPFSKTVLIFLQAGTLLFTTIVAIKYEPFFVALVYRSVNPKKEDSAEEIATVTSPEI